MLFLLLMRPRKRVLLDGQRCDERQSSYGGLEDEDGLQRSPVRLYGSLSKKRLQVGDDGSRVSNRLNDLRGTRSRNPFPQLLEKDRLQDSAAKSDTYYLSGRPKEIRDSSRDGYIFPSYRGDKCN